MTPTILGYIIKNSFEGVAIFKYGVAIIGKRKGNTPLPGQKTIDLHHGDQIYETGTIQHCEVSRGIMICFLKNTCPGIGMEK